MMKISSTAALAFVACVCAVHAQRATVRVQCDTLRSGPCPVVRITSNDFAAYRRAFRALLRDGWGNCDERDYPSVYGSYYATFARVDTPSCDDEARCDDEAAFIPDEVTP